MVLGADREWAEPARRSPATSALIAPPPEVPTILLKGDVNEERDENDERDVGRYERVKEVVRLTEDL